MLTSLLPLTRVVQEFEEGAPHPRQRSEELTLPEFLPEVCPSHKRFQIIYFSD